MRHLVNEDVGRAPWSNAFVVTRQAAMTTDVRLIALGADAAGDDAAALIAARSLQDDDRLELLLAGRPGEALLDLLDTSRPVVLVDVVRTGSNPGHVHQLRLRDLVERAAAMGLLPRMRSGQPRRCGEGKSSGAAWPRVCSWGLRACASSSERR
jgi:hypothetical protein